jgi:ABC-2 type transport system permease protein
MLKYWAIFKAQLANRVVYLGDLIAQSLTILFFMFIFTQLWRVTYRAAGDENGLASTISGLSLRQVLWYLMLAETIMLSTPRLSQSVSTAVKDGSIAYLLNKPYNFLLYQMSVGLGDSLIHMVFNALVGGALVWILVGPPPDPVGWPLVLIGVLLSLALNFSISSMIGLLAFVTEEVSAFEWIYQKFVMILGGLLIPLDFLPGWLRSIALALPFSYTIYGPARLFVEPSLERFLWLITGQLAWLAVAGLLAAWLYRRGVAWLSINGG